jgi:tRNA-dihydrouridine synthase A
VQEGGIGASLYADWARVAACVAAMRAAVAIPVTVKCRIGVDHCDTFDYLVQFTDGVAQAGCDYLIVHARKAWLQGLNPKQNRTIPPLRYDIVKALSQEVDIPIVLNGGLTSLADINQQLMDFPAVMVGRYACSHPLEIARFKSMNHRRVVDVLPILEHYFVYMERCMHAGERVTFLLQPLHGFFRNQKGAKCWRQLLASVQTRIQANEKPTTLWPEVVSQLYALQMTD